MPRRLWRRAVRWFAAFMFAAAAQGPVPAAPRIVAIGDLHGDYQAYHAIVRAAGLIDANDRWAGGDAILVQTGDIVDRGPASLRIIRHLVRLRAQAARAGGRVVTLLGNHEAMNLLGDLRYVHPGEYAAFAGAGSERRRQRAFDTNRIAIEAAYRARDPSRDADAIRQAWLAATPLGKIEHRAAWSPHGELGRWAMASPVMVLIEGNLFVHGGISAAFADLPIAEVNRRAIAALTARDLSETAIVNDPLGPLWYRGLADAGTEDAVRAAAAPTIEQQLERVFRTHGARRIVVGHTPRLDGIAILHGGRLALIDTGIAAAYGGPWTYLEIEGDTLSARVVRERRP